MFAVKICFVLGLTGILLNGATAMIHSVMDFRTSSTQVPNFPEFVYVEVVNGLTVYHYDSKTRRAVPKQEWMNRVTEDEPQFWETNTQMDIGIEQVEKGNIEIVRQRFNQTEGLHIWQVMSGCDWNDETDEIRGYDQYAFDGEDFISLDWDTQTWVAAKSQAFATKLKLERTGAAVQVKSEVTHHCTENLKKYVKLGEKSLKRKELPVVWLLQKSSSSPVTCHATGFYPQRSLLFWAKDGVELDEDPGEILPNHDGTFQSSVSLDLSSVPTEDWGRYSCVFQLSGVPDDLVTVLDPSKIRTNEKKHTAYIVAAVSVLGAVVLAVIGYFVFRRYKAKQLTPQSSEPEVMQELNPQPQ